MGIQRIKRPLSHAGKRFLVNREPKLIENTKKSLFLQGRKTSQLITNCLKDLYSLKKPDAVLLGKKNDVLPFDDFPKVEGFARKYDTSLFAFASHTKKRPNNIILGRLFDGHLLDMVELGVEKFTPLSHFPKEKIPVGTKPCLLFAGPQFSEPDTSRLQNLLVDFFQREQVNCVRLQGLEHVIIFTLHDQSLFMRSYKIHLKKSGTKVPRIELDEIGPSIDFTIRRNKLASEDLFKSACKQPKQLKAKKVKNVSRDSFGSKLGRVHIKQQDINKLQTRKMKGLKKPKKAKS